MKLLQLCMKKRGIRFFSKIPKEFQNSSVSSNYKNYTTKERFLSELAKRENEYDMILITAHGAENKFIIPITQFDPYRLEHPERSFDKYRTYISIKETRFFKNDFVFAVSCLTAQELGPAVVKNGVIAYLGYDVIIENLFNVSDICMSSRVRDLYETVVKRIFIKELVRAVTKFLNDMQNVLMLKQWFSIQLEKSLIKFFSMSADEVYNTYGIGINKEIWNRNRQKLQIQQLNFFGEINRHLIIVGDPKYISLYGIENGCRIDKKTYDRLKMVTFDNKNYEKKFKDELEHLIEVQNELY